MNIHAVKAQESEHSPGTHDVVQKHTGNKSSFQFVDHRDQSVAQRKVQAMANGSPRAEKAARMQLMANRGDDSRPLPVQKKANRTGLPDTLKSGIEQLSGHSMDDVKVHYNSGKPAQMQAYAYAQGRDIHLGPGQEKHLPHEAWHVVQQAQGRVRPTMQLKGDIAVNDNPSLEQEADMMGSKAVMGVTQLAGKGEMQYLSSIAHLSGISTRGVRVDYNSMMTAPLQAHACAQSTGSHAAPEQERHLPNETWSFSQQRQGAAQPAVRFDQGIRINDDASLERRVEGMGRDTLQAISEPFVQAKAVLCEVGGVVQRIIHYKKRGKWSDRKKLIDAIADYFKADEQMRETIEEMVVADEEDMSDKVEWDADGYYKDFIYYALRELGWKPPFEKKSTNDRHGPQIPVNTSIKNPRVSARHSSENTFTWPSKTMGLAQVIFQGKVVFDTIKYSDDGVHAEEQMITLIDAFVEEMGYRWEDVKVRVTINNFPCDHRGAQCGKRIAEWAKRVRMSEIHIYYANKYEGPPDGFRRSWEAMKSCGITVNLTPFNASEYLEHSEFGIRSYEKFKPETPSGKEPDPFSGDEDDGDGAHGGRRHVVADHEIDVIGERDLDREIIDSVRSYLQERQYVPQGRVFVVDGTHWTCYVRCVLFHLMRIDLYDEVIKRLSGVVDVGSGVMIGTDEEGKIQAIITEVAGQQFYVQATDVGHGHVAQSNNTVGMEVKILLTGAHFSLLY